MKKYQLLLALLPILFLSNTCLFSQIKRDFVADDLLDAIEYFIDYEDSLVSIGILNKRDVINIDFYRKDDGFCYMSINSSLTFYNQGLIGGFLFESRLIAFYAGRNFCFMGLINQSELKQEFSDIYISYEESEPLPHQERTFEFRINNPNELIFLNKNF